jgi:protoheme IX farnesyltransferase
MAPHPVLTISDVSVLPGRRVVGFGVFADYWAITKPEVNFLVAITTAAAFSLASPPALPQFPWIPLLHTVFGTVLVASGAAVLNEWMEYPFDARMRRTARRPIAAGRLDPYTALIFGMVLTLAGTAYLMFAAGVLTSLLALGTLVAYLLFYTPLKRLTPLCTLVGAVPGAAPPLIGWAAARGHLDGPAWVLFSIVFLWQFPHFMSIAWMYRDDYDRAGYRVLPPSRPRAAFVNLQTLVPLVALLPASLLQVPADEPSVFYSTGALLLGFGFLYVGLRFAFVKSGAAARRLLIASIIYLPALLALMIVSA